VQHWFIGIKGESCTDTCNAQGMSCTGEQKDMAEEISSLEEMQSIVSDISERTCSEPDRIAPAWSDTPSIHWGENCFWGGTGSCDGKAAHAERLCYCSKNE
jgi:hypothetical protein